MFNEQGNGFKRGAVNCMSERAPKREEANPTKDALRCPPTNLLSFDDSPVAVEPVDEVGEHAGVQGDEPGALVAHYPLACAAVIVRRRKDGGRGERSLVDQGGRQTQVQRIHERLGEARADGEDSVGGDAIGRRRLQNAKGGLASGG